ncbi:hypothetical protein RRG08_011120 [Elysia crispata]|uniref:Uncharacterized protein n=1 Tax=Elysia crispata TaxID=231223 RepID=A0AAE1A122_9GAST|nr:hypothetical protein RRG08_011120 [Elysia crispata]
METAAFLRVRVLQTFETIRDLRINGEGWVDHAEKPYTSSFLGKVVDSVDRAVLLLSAAPISVSRVARTEGSLAP